MENTNTNIIEDNIHFGKNIIIDIDNNNIVEFGNKAYEMRGTTPNNIRIINPIENSIITDLELAKALIEEKGEYTAMMVLRGIAPKFLNSFPDMKKAKNKLASALTTRDSLERILNEIQ